MLRIRRGYMTKRIFISLISLTFLLVISGCNVVPNRETDSRTAYDEWRESQEARDFTGNRRIDEDDYEIYLRITDFDYWLNSDGAMDYNEDRRINQADHEIFILLYDFDAWLVSDKASDLNGDGRIDLLDHTIYKTQTDFEFWLNSSNAIDLNGDRRIDRLDFEIYQSFLDVAGSYRLTNFQYRGQRQDFILVNRREYLFLDIGLWLTQLTFDVDFSGHVTVTISQELEQELQSVAPLLLDFVSNATVSRISRLITVLDTFVVVGNNQIDYTFYFEASSQGLVTTFIIDYLGRPTELSFEMIRND